MLEEVAPAPRCARYGIIGDCRRPDPSHERRAGTCHNTPGRARHDRINPIKNCAALRLAGVFSTSNRRMTHVTKDNRSRVMLAIGAALPALATSQALAISSSWGAVAEMATR